MDDQPERDYAIGREQQQRILDFARANGIWIIADEIYARLVYDRPVAPSFLEICEADDPVMVINSFSKSWAMTGWRVGWIVAPPAIGQALENLVQYSTSGVAQFMQKGALKAITDGDAFVDHYAATRDWEEREFRRAITDWEMERYFEII